MHILAIVPARGGSKGIRRKNLAVLAGRPLVYYSIKVALDSELISRVVTSTEDLEIAATARKYGAEVPFMRPDELAGDHSTDFEVFEHVLKNLEEGEGYVPDLVVHLRPTCPIRKSRTIDEGVRVFLQNPQADSLRSVSLATETPYKMWRIGRDGLMRPILGLDGKNEPFNMPRQQLPLVYWQNGYLDITRYSTIMEKGSMTGPTVVPLIVDERIVDIDYAPSLKEAERILLGKDSEAGIDQSNIRRYPG